MDELDKKTRKTILRAQKNEITEYHIYRKLAGSMKGPYNKIILNRVAKDELRHYKLWKEYTGETVKPSKFNIWKYFMISRIFGITFGIKMMERGEVRAQAAYSMICKQFPDTECILNDEEEHEKKLIEMIDDDRLKYTGSIVRGLNDALVELTGALAGFPLAFANSQLIAVIGLITGISGCLSMGTSEYLACKSEECVKHPLKASAYSAGAFLLTVMFLIAPYFFLDNAYYSLPVTILVAIFLIYIFNFYISVAKDLSLKKRFFEMTGISLGIAALTFGIGLLIRSFFNIDI